MPWPSPCSSTAGCPGLLSGRVVTVSEDGDSTISLGNLFQGLITLKEVLFSVFKWNFSYLNTCLSLLVLSLVRSPEPPLLQTLSAPWYVRSTLQPRAGLQCFPTRVVLGAQQQRVQHSRCAQQC